MIEHCEDELPELTVNVGKNAKSKAIKQCAISSNSTAISRSRVQDAVKGNVRLLNLDLHIDENSDKLQKDANRTRSRRRVLRRISNNPLLLPLQLPKGKRSQSSSASSYVAHSTPPAGLRACNEAKPRRRMATSNYKSTDETSTSANDTTGLSDFIVDDHSYIESEDSADSPQVQPRTITRKLVRGRRHASSDSIWEDGSTAENFQRSRSQSFSQSRDVPTNESTVNHFKTPPQSPFRLKGKLLSPKKTPRIPMTPHHKNTDDFWTRDIIDEWNDQYFLKPVPDLSYSATNDVDNSWESELPKKKPEPTADRAIAKARKNFNRIKHSIAEAFLFELDKVITESKVSEMSASTGGIKIVWSKTLKTTAGRANWKRETVRSPKLDSNKKSVVEVTYRHHATIELSEKVIDNEDRLLNVIAHEFCHLANFMVSGVRNNPHGKEFKSWASKCSRKFGDRGINVTTKHTYVIEYKYIWTCTNCGAEFKRHSKSIDPQRHQCGSCKSKLIQTKPVPRAVVVANEYQLFVKDNMKKVKQDNPRSPQKDVMSIVGKLYQRHKASRLDESPTREIPVDATVSKSSKEPYGGDAIDLVAKRLNFLDLTGP